MFFNEGFTSFHFHQIERVDLGNFRDEIGVKFNGMVIGTMGRKLIMGFLREDICKVFTPLWDDWFHHLGGLGDLGGDGDLVNPFPFQPSLSLVQSVGDFSICIEA